MLQTSWFVLFPLNSDQIDHSCTADNEMGTCGHTMKWELVDMGSLNGTFLNSQAVHHPDVGSRHWGEPAELADGDIIALGTSSKLSVGS